MVDQKQIDEQRRVAAQKAQAEADKRAAESRNMTDAKAKHEADKEASLKAQKSDQSKTTDTIFPPLKNPNTPGAVAERVTPNMPNPATPAETDTPAKRLEAEKVAERANVVERKDPIAFIRRLWAGGEHKRAAEEVVLAKLSQTAFDELAAEMPDLRLLVSGINEEQLRKDKHLGPTAALRQAQDRETEASRTAEDNRGPFATRK